MVNPVQSDDDARASFIGSIARMLAIVGLAVAAGVFLMLARHPHMGPDDPSTPVSSLLPLKKQSQADEYFYEAKQLDAQGKHDQAADLYCEAIAVHRTTSPNGKIRFDTVLAWAGQNASRRNERKEAIKLFQEAVDRQYKRLGPKHEHIAMNLISLASVYHDDHDYRASLRELDRAFAMEDVISERLRADIQYWYGDIYKHLEEYERAAPHLKAAVEMRKRCASAHDRANAMRKYSSVLRKLSRNDEADEMARQAEAISR